MIRVHGVPMKTCQDQFSGLVQDAAVNLWAKSVTKCLHWNALSRQRDSLADGVFRQIHTEEQTQV